MIEPIDKKIYKTTYSQTYLRKLNEVENLSTIAMALSFISKMQLLSVYQDYCKAMIKELKDEDIRISMLQERENQ